MLCGCGAAADAAKCASVGWAIVSFLEKGRRIHLFSFKICEHFINISLNGEG